MVKQGFMFKAAASWGLYHKTYYGRNKFYDTGPWSYWVWASYQESG
jgi:hypothetical protein